MRLGEQEKTQIVRFQENRDREREERKEGGMQAQRESPFKAL